MLTPGLPPGIGTQNFYGDYGPSGSYGAWPSCGCSSLFIILAGILLVCGGCLRMFGQYASDSPPCLLFTLGIDCVWGMLSAINIKRTEDRRFFDRFRFCQRRRRCEHCAERSLPPAR